MYQTPSQEFTFRLNPEKTAFRLLFFGGIYIVAVYNYLLFHSIVEVFSIVIAFTVSMIAWHSRFYINHSYLLFIGIAYLFIGGIDLLHTLSYKGMGIFANGSDYATQLWIGARYMESISLLVAFFFLRKNQRLHPNLILLSFSIVTGILILSIMTLKVFPACFIEGTGLTPFKIVSEYIISSIIIVSIMLLYKNKSYFEPLVFRYMLWSMLATILSELSFTFYISKYGFSNFLGHCFKLISFVMIYRSLIHTSIREPYLTIFRNLNKANENLKKEIERRKKSEAIREAQFAELKNAQDEIKTLEGILPICMHCKKIRDDNDNWAPIESYVSKHSEAEFSHGICPDCMKKFYSEYE